jgi:hypothetical protein
VEVVHCQARLEETFLVSLRIVERVVVFQFANLANVAFLDLEYAYITQFPEHIFGQLVRFAWHSNFSLTWRNRAL